MTADPARARFADMSAGYESFYLRACRPDGGLGVWIRYTVHRRRGAEPTGSLWFTLFDSAAPAPLPAKVTAPGPESGGADWIRVGGAAIGAGHATGRVEGIAWELSFNGAETLYHLPRAWMYRTPLPRTKPVSLHPVARFDGTISLPGREIQLDGWPGMVGHNWGSQHAERWIWLHGMGFTGRDDGTWLDAVLGRIKIGRWTTPWIASGAISIEGQRFALGGIGRARATRVAERPERLDFVLPGHRIDVSGTVQAPRAHFVGWVYADPDGSEHHTVNCSIADLDLSVFRHGSSPLTLGAVGLATYELGMREHDHGMAIQPHSEG